MSRGGEKMADKNTTSNINLAAAEELPKAQSKFKEFVKKFMKRKTAVISLAFIVFIILMAIIGPYVVPYSRSPQRRVGGPVCARCGCIAYPATRSGCRGYVRRLRNVRHDGRTHGLGPNRGLSCPA